MSLKKRVFIILLFILVTGAVLSVHSYYFNLPKGEREVSKEYFYDQEINNRGDFFNKAILRGSDQVASLIFREKIFLPIDFRRQEHALTCEAAALRMSLNYLGIDVTEDELLEKLAFSTTTPRSPENIWGDPQKGFVGNINGSIFFGTGYGVYNQPIEELAQEYSSSAKIMKNPSLEKLLHQVKNGNPVIVWGLLSSKYEINWYTPEGDRVKAFPGEHARIVIGYVGDIDNPSSIILMDPLYGKVKMSTERFLLEWGMLDNMSVIVS